MIDLKFGEKNLQPYDFLRTEKEGERKEKFKVF